MSDLYKFPFKVVTTTASLPFKAVGAIAKPVVKAPFKMIKKNPLRLFDFMWGYDMYGEALNRFDQNMMKLGSALDTVAKLTLIGGGLLGIGATVAELLRRKQLEDRAVEAFQKVVKNDPLLSEVPDEELYYYFQAIKDTSPTIAANPVTLRTALRQMATYGGVDVASMSAMSEIEANRAKSETLRKVLLDLSHNLRETASGLGE